MTRIREEDCTGNVKKNRSVSTAVISRAIRLDPQLLICRPHKGKFLLCRADSRGPLLNAEVLVFDVVNAITIQGL